MRINLDELEQQIRAVSNDSTVQQVADQLSAWKTSSATVDDLAKTLERYIGNTWVGSLRDHERVYTLWAAFRKESIEIICGMTMNERLYSFGLLERFDALRHDDDKKVLYRKLHADIA